MPAFDRHSKTGTAIGRIVVGYGELEFDFCRLIAALSGNFDAAIKIMFRTRGESQRIQVADGFVRNLIPEGAFRKAYEETVAHLRYCIKIRNQYAHCNWVESVNGADLVFIDLEEIAKPDTSADSGTLTMHLIKEKLALEQEQFLILIMDWVNWLRLECDCDAGRATRPHFLPTPPRPTRPPLYSPREELESPPQAEVPSEIH